MEDKIPSPEEIIKDSDFTIMAYRADKMTEEELKATIIRFKNDIPANKKISVLFCFGEFE